jgi:thermitase
VNRRLASLLVLGGLLCLLRPGATPRLLAQGNASPRLIVRLRRGGDATALSRLNYARVDARWPAIDGYALSVTHGSPAQARARLLADPRVASVEQDDTVVAAQEPNDQTFARQWALQAIQAPFAWELAHGSSNVVVAVLDSGVDLTHPDLAAHILPGGCNVVADGGCLSGSKLTPPRDLDGHGTAVAGIIAALTDNRIGIAGVAWNASILPVRVLSGGTGSESNVITGLLWAADQGAQVINLSFNGACGQPESAALRDALSYASSHGAVIVAASGNDVDCTGASYPAADPHVLAVASTDMDDRPSAISAGGSWVRASAPGDGILTTTIGGGFVVVSGTSYAAPYVAGLAALLMAVPGESNSDAITAITSTCDVPAKWDSKNYGCGRINAYRAVTLAINGHDPHTSSTATQTVHLAKGLNNVLYVGPTRRVATALASLQGKVGTIYTWDPIQARMLAYLPDQPAASDFSTLVDRQSYWLYMNAAADLTMQPTGTDPPPQLTLAPGWNNLPLPSGALPVPLQKLSSPVAGVWSWDAGKAVWQAYFIGASEASTLAAIEPTQPYWIYAPAAMTVRYGS